MTDADVTPAPCKAQSPGVLEKAETDSTAGVRRIADRTAKRLMVPRHEIESVEATGSAAVIVRRSRGTGHALWLVREGMPPASSAS